MKEKRLLVMSADALVQEDIPFLIQLKNFSRFFAGGACVRRVRSVYPSITYPAHAALLTGRTPQSNGVYSNLVTMDPNPDGRWCWDASNLQGDDLFWAAHRAGLRVGSAAWPVTSNHRAVDYLMPEYWMAFPAPSLQEAYAAHGCGAEVLELVTQNSRYLRPGYMKGKSHCTIYPHYDDFNLGVACDIIRRYAPEVLFVHWSAVDSARHANGVFNARVTAAVAKTDEYIGRLTDALEDAGVLEQTNLVLLSDHGQIDFTRRVKLNVLLADHGLLRVEPDGRIAADWQAYSLSNGLSAYVFVRDPRDERRVQALLEQAAQDGLYGFQEVLTRSQARERYQLDGDFSFIVETDGYSAFSDDARRPILAEVDLTDYRYGRATHGYQPEKGPQPVFYARGAAFRDGASLDTARIIDIAPTLAAALGLDLREAQGRVLAELLQE